VKGLVQLDAAIGLPQRHHGITQFNQVFALHGSNTRTRFFSLCFGGEGYNKKISHDVGS